MAKAGTAGAKPLSKSEVAATLADRVGISKKQAREFLQAQAELAYKQAKNSYVIPGIGKLVLAESPAREMVMQLRPQRRTDRQGPQAQEGQVPRRQGRQGRDPRQEVSWF